MHTSCEDATGIVLERMSEKKGVEAGPFPPHGGPQAAAWSVHGRYLLCVCEWVKHFHYNGTFSHPAASLASPRCRLLGRPALGSASLELDVPEFFAGAFFCASHSFRGYVAVHCGIVNTESYSMM